MKVVLQRDFEGLGRIGDVVKVADGYGFNFLIPRGIAVLADEGNVRHLDHLKRLAEQKRRQALKDAESQADRINGMAISLRRKAGEEDRLFGSVTHRDIVEALAQEGIEIDRHAIVLEEPIKTIGVFNVPVRVHTDVEARLKVYVIRE
ncbi:MAG: 50S ribosomal protein L9 [Deltaproteobacteria bacterium]|nr:50S ribosomal protein L9 [Deltaproteobacteria bacterium]